MSLSDEQWTLYFADFEQLQSLILAQLHSSPDAKPLLQRLLRMLHNTQQQTANKSQSNNNNSSQSSSSSSSSASGCGSEDQSEHCLVCYEQFSPQDENHSNCEQKTTNDKSKDGDKQNDQDKSQGDDCQSDADDDDCRRASLRQCACRCICIHCLSSHIASKVSPKHDSSVADWPRCPAEDCDALLHPDDLVHYSSRSLTLKQWLRWCRAWMQQRLRRCPRFVPCVSQNCSHGFLVASTDAPARTATCLVCGKSQEVSPANADASSRLDPGFQAMVDSGRLRPCPACKHWTMKDFGLCNIIECIKCSIVWNWATRATGQSIRELKELARQDGTLWQPGELQHQLALQRHSPNEFKALLERNGIEYNPNHRRGID